MTPRLSLEERKDAVFHAIEAAAIAGDRCPQADQLPGAPDIVTRLCRDGRLYIEIFMHNWRVATILAGPHKGKMTLQPPPMPSGKQPRAYLTVGKETLRNGAPVVGARATRPIISLSFKDGKRDREVF